MKIQKKVESFVSQSAALPSLFAATSDEAHPMEYYSGCMEMKGPVGVARVPGNAKDVEVAKKLWDVSNQLTGVNWP
jgi:hypothetical protein